MTTLSSSVGRKENGVAAQSLPGDQSKIISLLSRISPEDGGQRGAWSPPPPGKAYQPPGPLVLAIRTFQQRWVPTGEVKKADGVVDPLGSTLKQLDAKSLGLPVGPGGTNPDERISIEQISLGATVPYINSMAVLGPVYKRQPLTAVQIISGFYLFLFRIEKDGKRYWVGVSAPPMTTDFKRVQVFLHATPGQAGVKESDYYEFKGDWSGRMYNYVVRCGTQLAAIRPMLLIVPFMIDAATAKDSPANVFATRPLETLNMIVTATHREMASRMPIVGPSSPHKVEQLGVTSFSSGISFMRAFIAQFGGSGIIKETIDLDSRWIIPERKKPFVKATGIRADWISQWVPPPPVPGQAYHYPQPPHDFIYAPPQSLERIADIGEDAHHTLGFFGYYQAMLRSELT